MGFGSKERRGTGFLVFCLGGNGARAKNERWGGGGEGRKRLQTNPWILNTSVRQRTGLVIGWAGRKLLTCVDQRPTLWVLERSERRVRNLICLQKLKALAFLAERGFSRRLRQYGRNSVVQCRRFGI